MLVEVNPLLITPDGEVVHDPHHHVAAEAGELLVWGFTAGLLDKLLELGGWAQPWDTGRRRALDPAMVTLAARGATFPAGLPGSPNV